MVKLADQIAEVKRELAQRQRVYATLIDMGRLTPELASERTMRMRAVLDTLEQAFAHAQQDTSADDNVKNLSGILGHA